MPALLTQMDALRKQRLATILRGLNAKADQYSLTQLLIDLEDYFQAGTIPYAIMTVNAEGGAASQKASAEIKGLKIFSLNYNSDEASDAIRVWLLNGGKLYDASRRKELEDWLKSENVGAGISAFLNTSDFSGQRSDFLKKIKPQ